MIVQQHSSNPLPTCCINIVLISVINSNWGSHGNAHHLFIIIEAERAGVVVRRCPLFLQLEDGMKACAVGFPNHTIILECSRGFGTIHLFREWGFFVWAPKGPTLETNTPHTREISFHLRKRGRSMMMISCNERLESTLEPAVERVLTLFVQRPSPFPTRVNHTQSPFLSIPNQSLLVRMTW